MLLQIEILIRSTLGRRFGPIHSYSYSLLIYFFFSWGRMSLYSFLHVISALLPALPEIGNIWNFHQLKKPHRLSARLGTWQNVETWIDCYVTPAQYMAKIMANWDREGDNFPRVTQPPTCLDFLCSVTQFRTLGISVSILV